MMTQTTHRPWPIPKIPWVMSMRWHDVLFLHWPVRPDVIRSLIPASLEIDTFDQWAWIGILPFRMSGVRPRLVPALIYNSAFPEINVRTYVKTPGRSGVWFFSLDAMDRRFVLAARMLYRLPYYFSRMSCANLDESISYHSKRAQRKFGVAEFKATYRPSGAIYHAQRDSFDYWLTERYCLFTSKNQDKIGYADIDHRPWQLQPAEAEIQTNTMAAPLGIDLPQRQPIMHFARQLDVVAWGLVRDDMPGISR